MEAIANIIKEEMFSDSRLIVASVQGDIKGILKDEFNLLLLDEFSYYSSLQKERIADGWNSSLRRSAEYGKNIDRNVIVWTSPSSASDEDYKILSKIKMPGGSRLSINRFSVEDDPTFHIETGIPAGLTKTEIDKEFFLK